MGHASWPMFWKQCLFWSLLRLREFQILVLLALKDLDLSYSFYFFSPLNGASLHFSKQKRSRRAKQEQIKNYVHKKIASAN